MRSLEVLRLRTQLGDSDCTLIYFITVDDIADAATALQFESYGVGITICERNETAVVRCVTQNSVCVYELIRKLHDHIVTPVTVADVVYDWLAS
jgi:hypothetical protein